MNKDFFVDRGNSIMGDMTREEQKQLYKEALKEWWTEQWNKEYQRFGKWIAHIVAAGVVVVAAYGAARLAGWQLVPPHV